MASNALIEDMYDLFAEARTEGIEVVEARRWVAEWVKGLDGEQVKDIAHLFGVPFQGIHLARLKAELVGRVTQEMLNF